MLATRRMNHTNNIIGFLVRIQGHKSIPDEKSPATANNQETLMNDNRRRR